MWDLFSLSDLTRLSVVASGSIRVGLDGAVSPSSGLVRPLAVISKDTRELQRFQLQNISQFPGRLMEFSHKPDVGGSDLASYICPK